MAKVTINGKEYNQKTIKTKSGKEVVINELIGIKSEDPTDYKAKKDAIKSKINAVNTNSTQSKKLDLIIDMLKYKGGFN